VVASYRNFQLRHNLPAISEDLEEALLKCMDYDICYSFLEEIFPPLKNKKVAEVFYSNKKSLFDPILGDPELVKAGLHPFRRWAAQLAHQKRIDTSSYFHIQEYHINGFTKLVHNQVLDMILDLNSEFDNITYSVNKQPFNLLKGFVVQAPKFRQIHELIKPYIIACIAKNPTADILFKYDWNTFLQRVHNRPDDNDNQKEFHIDTFFPAIKWWLFTQAVEADKGAFWYVPGSALVVDKYLDWVYNQTIRIAEGYEKRKDHIEGSFRASIEDLERMGYGKLQPLTAKAGTLVIGNVAGFHRRGDTVEPIVRNALHGSIRLDNPFTF
jgi:hypothetical protein